MNGSQFWELYQSYGDVYRQEVLNEEYEELDEGRTEEIRNRMQARYGKPESRDTLRQHVARKKYETASANHQSGWEKSPNTGKPGKLTIGQMMYKAHRSAEAMRGNVNASYEYDLYDLVLEYLLDEGFADTFEDAQVLMANMSEQWIESIVEASEDSEVAAELARLRGQMKTALQKGDKATIQSISKRLADLQPAARAKTGAALKENAETLAEYDRRRKAAELAGDRKMASKYTSIMSRIESAMGKSQNR